ncbi:hypothetical protein ZWY2020_022079 [Hordeum vulgare]|nr:hypothetical protein ZWY2020_022079 [Hordeum vulgare]
MSQAAENFDSSLMVALFDAKLLFVLNEFDAAEGECRRELCINTPNDPSWDDIPPMAAVGGDSDARVSYVKKQLRVFLEQTILGLNSSCDGNKFLDFLWQNMCSKHPDELLGKLQSVIDPEYCESLLLSPSVEIQAEPFAEMGQRKCREGSEILLIIREKLRMLPEDTLSTEANDWLACLHFQECYSMRKRIPSYLNHPGTRRIGFAHANIDIICGTSDQSVKEIASTSSIQQSLNVSNKHNANKELSILSISSTEQHRHAPPLHHSRGPRCVGVGPPFWRCSPTTTPRSRSWPRAKAAPASSSAGRHGDGGLALPNDDTAVDGSLASVRRRRARQTAWTTT